MNAFDRIVIIFNPQSTGDAPRARPGSSRTSSARRLPDVPVDAAPTQHAGHARDLAREAAGTGRPLIVSVSGDGGYNEVVNGVMDAGNAQRRLRGARGRERQRPPPDDPGATAGRRDRGRRRPPDGPAPAHRRQRGRRRDPVRALLHRRRA